MNKTSASLFAAILCGLIIPLPAATSSLLSALLIVILFYSYLHE